MNPICENCKFFKAGECHRYPPTAHYVFVPAEKEMHYLAQWPQVQEEDWCGEFEPRKD